MPRGPFNFPRFTDIGPFSGELVTVVEERRDIDIAEGKFPEVDDLEDEGIITGTVGDFHDVKLAFRSEIGGNLQDNSIEIERVLGRMQSATFTDDGVGVRIFTTVNASFQRQGVATELWEQTKRIMEDEGVDTVYSFPVTIAGEELLEAHGFTEAGNLVLRPGWVRRDL